MTTRVPLRRRGALLFAAFLVADAGLALAACSTASPDPEGVDATTEATPPGVDAAKDAPPVISPEGGKEGGGNCSAAKGPCDIVLQDCPAQQECTVNASNATECQPVQTSQQLPIGRGCCPNGNSNPCLPGLTCVGNPCVDGGPATTGRCSPACCKGDDQACGKSDPEGISGACDLSLVSGAAQVPLHDVCTYRQRCKPFKVEPCNAGETCLVEDKVGTASCVDLFGAGKTNRQPCALANDCADGLVCLGGGADGGTCHFVCLLPGSTHPFDAGVQTGGPGRGGCGANEVCNLLIKDKPDWFAACSLDGG